MSEAAELSELDATNLLLAAAEVLANAERHGGGTPSVRVGRVGDRFVCEVSDDGPGIDDPLAGFLPPRPGHADGAGPLGGPPADQAARAGALAARRERAALGLAPPLQN